MDNVTLTKWKSLANDAVIATFGQDNRESQLAQALEQAVEAIGDWDAMEDKVEALDEENANLDQRVKDLRGSLCEIYSTTKSANSSDVKRLADIQEICEAADVDLRKDVAL